MAKLPSPFSWQAVEIEAMLSQGRTEDARTALHALLASGTAAGPVQAIAARLIKPGRKPPGRPRTYPERWLEIAMAFEERRADGATREIALAETAQRFGYSESHITTCVRLFLTARQEAG